MKKKYVYTVLIGIIVVVIVGVALALCHETVTTENCILASRPAEISPDYSGMIIPPNIAPLNFVVREAGSGYFVKIHCARGEAIEIFSRSPRIRIPLRRWQSLLKGNRGDKLFFDVYVKGEDSRWNRYETIANTIAQEAIDGHIAYRLIKPIYAAWNNIGVYQRNLENYDESVVLHGSSFGNACVNCHSFLNNQPDNMFIGIRSGTYGSSAILAENVSAKKVGTRFGYTAWHPSGRLVAYSMNKVTQFFHTTGTEVRDVVDLDSSVVYYPIGSKSVKTVPGACEKLQLETYPTWSPDGRYLYYCSAPMLWTDREAVPPKHYDKVRYSLKRIGYDLETDAWGEPETVLSAAETGLSILLPRISPDGRFLLFCMCKYGCFPIYQPSSDLYLMDLQRGDYRRLAINREHSESWHSWSSNSRWIAFSSKRRDGVFTRIYLSYVDQDGKVYKPLILPQKDPVFYESFLKTYSVPELISGPIPVSHRALATAVRSRQEISVEMPISGATPKVEGAQGTEPWRQGVE